MDIQSVKGWQWAVLGAVVGLGMGLGQLAGWQSERIGGEGFISQAAFERELHRPPIAQYPRIRNLVIQSAGEVDLLWLEHLVPAANAMEWRYESAKLAAPRPYKAADSDAIYPGVRERLMQLAQVDSSVSFRYAWWREPQAAIALWMLGGAMGMGGIWPMLLRWLGGAGLGKPVGEPEYDLKRFQREPELAAASEPPPAEEARLRELEDQLRHKLEEQAADAAPNRPEAGPASQVKPLRGGPGDEAQAQTSSEEAKHFEGEYYPVEKRRGSDATAEGFSLVELLVVMGIVTLLVSILLPAIRLARLSAQQVQCASQLRQLGMALVLYSNANKGWLPSWSGWQTYPDGGSSEDEPGPGWTELLAPHFVQPDSPLYNCPGYPGPERCRNYFLAAQWSGRSGQHAMKLTDIKMTGRFVLAGEKTQRALYPPPFGTRRHREDDCDPDDFGGDLAILAWPWQEGGFWMHRGGNNLLFDDGHVALFGKYDSTRMTFHPTQMQDWAEVTPGY